MTNTINEYMDAQEKDLLRVVMRYGFAKSPKLRKQYQDEIIQILFNIRIIPGTGPGIKNIVEFLNSKGMTIQEKF